MYQTLRRELMIVPP